jgi:enoyl-CoA hydratase
MACVARLGKRETGMSTSTMTVSVSDNIAKVELSRPGAFNSMNRAFWGEIREVFTRLNDDPEVRVAVLSSTGKHFTAGLDLKEFAGIGAEAAGDLGRRREAFRRMVINMQESFNVIERARFPVLAAVQGGCIGGGVDLVTACDMRYCTANAFFCVKEIAIGITADVGTLQRLPRLIPDGLARELSFTGRNLAAEEARSSGLVNQVFADQAAMLEGVMAIARTIASHSPLAMTGTKEMLNYGRNHSITDGLNYVATWNAGMLAGEDLPEAMKAGRERRAPNYAGLEKPSL